MSSIAPSRRLDRVESPAKAGADPQYGETLRTLFQSGTVSAGKFRCPKEHPLFRDSGPIRSFVLVFPRTAGDVQFEGEKPFFVSPLVSPFYNQGQRYIRTEANVGGDRSDWFAIHDRRCVIDLVREVDPSVDDHHDRPLRLRFAPTSPAAYARQVFLLASLASPDPPEPAAVEEEVFALFRAALKRGYSAGKAPPRTRVAKENREEYLRLRLEIQRSYRRRLPLASLADATGMSEVNLCRLFRKHQGTSVHQTIVELRLRESLEWLGDSRIDLGALAVELGFSSHSHFTAAFRRAFGLTPSEARLRLSRRRLKEWGERLLPSSFRLTN